MYRVLGIAVTLLWITAMGTLVVRDVWPAWTAQEPPKVISGGEADGSVRRSQSGIFDARNQRVGTAWTVLRPAGDQHRLESTVALLGIAMLPPLRIEMNVSLKGTGELDDFDLGIIGVKDVYGSAMKIEMRGESYGRYIPCTLQVGPFQRTLKLDESATRLLGDGIRPFQVLRDLKVGQTWRMQMLDPISAVLNQQARVTPLIAKVERKETITHRGRQVECFVVTAGRACAWVAPEGDVLVQEADVPGLGRLTIRDEPFEEDGRANARKSIRARSDKD